MKKLLLFAIALFYITNTFAQTYCTTSYLYGCYYMGIEKIVIDSSTVNIANTSTLSTGCQNPTSGYTDFSGSPSLGTLYIGASYTTTITTNGSYSQYVGIFVDINQNGNFSDAGEFLGTTTIYGSASQAISTKIPANAKLGNTIMRIVSNFSNDGMDQYTACNTNLSYGETEDYTINIATTPMKYGTSTTNAIPNGTMVYPGNTNQYVLQVQVEMNGTLNPTYFAERRTQIVRQNFGRGMGINLNNNNFTGVKMSWDARQKLYPERMKEICKLKITTKCTRPRDIEERPRRLLLGRFCESD